MREATLLFGTVDRINSVQRLLASIDANTVGIDFGIVLVDGSRTHSAWNLVRGRRNVQYFEDTERGGFSKAYNLGARLARGEFLVWLNDDCAVCKGWLKNTLKFMRTRKDVGVGALLWREGTRRHVRQHIFDIFYANFGCIRTGLWHRLGGFDERYHSYGAETDLCFRVMREGLKVRPVPDVEIEHFRVLDELKRTMHARRLEGLRLFKGIWCERLKGLAV